MTWTARSGWKPETKIPSWSPTSRARAQVLAPSPATFPDTLTGSYSEQSNQGSNRCNSMECQLCSQQFNLLGNNTYPVISLNEVPVQILFPSTICSYLFKRKGQSSTFLVGLFSLFISSLVFCICQTYVLNIFFSWAVACIFIVLEIFGWFLMMYSYGFYFGYYFCVLYLWSLLLFYLQGKVGRERRRCLWYNKSLLKC